MSTHQHLRLRPCLVFISQPFITSFNRVWLSTWSEACLRRTFCNTEREYLFSFHSKLLFLGITSKFRHLIQAYRAYARGEGVRRSVCFLIGENFAFLRNKNDKIMSFLITDCTVNCYDIFMKFRSHAHQYVSEVWCEFGNDSPTTDRDVSLLRTSVVNLTLLRPRKPS